MEKIYSREEIYTETFEKNSDEILKEIEDIKAVIAGRHLSFSNYIQTDDVIDDTKLNHFINELLSYIKERDEKYNIEFTENRRLFFYNFLNCSILYCVIACRADDAVFESILKLAGTVDKENSKDESVLDILIGDLQEEKNSDELCSLLHSYEMFNNLFDECYENRFFKDDVRHGLNTFLELRKLSKYTRPDNRKILYALTFAKRNLMSL